MARTIEDVRHDPYYEAVRTMQKDTGVGRWIPATPEDDGFVLEAIELRPRITGHLKTAC